MFFMKKLGLAVLVFLVGFACVYAYVSDVPNPGHGADRVFVGVNGEVMSLQAAVDDGDFDGSDYSGTGVSADLDFGHRDVYVSVDGEDKTLQDAINDGSLCLFDGGSGSYSGDLFYGHDANDVLVDYNGEMNLQSAINAGKFAGKWDASEDEFCAGESFTKSRCGVSEESIGTKECCEEEYTYLCYGGDVYWYDSCGDRGSVKEYCSGGCTGSSCDVGSSCFGWTNDDVSFYSVFATTSDVGQLECQAFCESYSGATACRWYSGSNVYCHVGTGFKVGIGATDMPVWAATCS